MITRPLYPELPAAPIDSGPELLLNDSCSLCRCARGARHRCLPADGDPGGVLLVGFHPGPEEDARGRVHVGASGSLLRKTVAKHWSGPVALDNALRCYPRDVTPAPADVAACRPYLRRVLRDAAPERIVALGGDAVQALFGSTVPILSVRRGYGWLTPPWAPVPVPVYLVIHPAAATRNRFVGQWFEADLAWALRSPRPPDPPWGSKLHVVETPEDAELAVSELRAEAPWFAYDIEWAGVPFGSYFELTCLAAVSSGTDEAFVWPRSVLYDPDVAAPIKRLLEDPTVGKVGHNLKGDNLAVLAAWGTRVRGSYADTRLWRRLLEADVTARLAVCAWLVGMGGHKAENEAELEKAQALIARERKSAGGAQRGLFASGDMDPALEAAVRLMPREDPKRFAYALVPAEIRDRYCARDAVATARLGDLQEPIIARTRPTSRIWSSVVSRATDAVSQMEAWGVPADGRAMEDFHRYCDVELDVVRRRLSTYGKLNPSSPDEVAALLFGKLGLHPVKMTESGSRASTDKAALAKLRGQHPIVDDLIEFRRLEKLQSNYGRGLAEWIRADGRIHPELKIDGTETGRLSCVNPPLQTLPRSHTVEGKMIKRAFRSSPGWKILVADYSQIELRIAAALSGDPVMRAMFESGEDFHTATAKLIAPIYWKIKPEDVTGAHRSAAKSFNFGLLYGMTDGGLAKRIGCTAADAARLRAAIMGAWKQLARWMKERIAETRRTGETWTSWGGEPARRRPLVGVASQDALQKIGAENSAINTPVQGTASDYMLASICDIVEWLLADAVPARLVLTVHDSVVLEVRDDAVVEVGFGVRDIMLSRDANGVPLKVDLECGETLGDQKTLELPDAA